MRAAALVTLILTVMLMVACAPKPESSRGFRLPDGDAAAGRATFVRLNCHGCHEVEGLELPEFDYAGPPLVRVKLGGKQPGYAPTVSWSPLLSIRLTA